MTVALRQAAIEFMKESECYVYTVSSFPLSANSTGPYQHVPPTDLQLAGVLEAWIIGASTPMDLSNPTLEYLAVSTNTAMLYPTVFLSGDDNINFSVWPAPGANCAMTYRASLYPTQTAATIPDYVFNTWGEAISLGARERLLKLPNKAWTNEALAQAYGAQFRGLINRARISKLRAATRAGQRVTPQPFGNGA